MTEKRKVRTFTRDGDDVREFQFLEDATEFMGVDLNHDLNSLVDEVADVNATIFLLEHHGEQPPREAGPDMPPEHRGALLACGFILMCTMPSLDPVLVVNTGDTFVMIATSAVLLASFLAKRWKQPVPVEPPPRKEGGRWVVSLTPELGLCRWAMGLSVRPGTPEA